MTNKQKPDGYVAFNSNNGHFSFCAKVYADWLDAAISVDIEQNMFEPEDSLDVIAAKLSEKGWRIRPVKLVFLDEVEDDKI